MRKYTRETINFRSITVIFIALLFIPFTNSSAAEYDSLKAELAAGNWQQTWLEPVGINKLNESPETFRALLDLVSNTGVDWRIRIRGIRVLGETGDPKAADFLMSLFYNSFAHSECPAIKSNLATALGNFKDDTRVVDALITGLDDREVLVREACASSLGRIKDVRALTFLVNKFNDPSVAVRMNAIRAVAQIGDHRAVPFLKALIVGDIDGGVRLEGKAALALLKAQ